LAIHSIVPRQPKPFFCSHLLPLTYILPYVIQSKCNTNVCWYDLEDGGLVCISFIPCVTDHISNR